MKTQPLVSGHSERTLKWLLKNVVRLSGFEPPTFGATIRRSNQLSYNRTWHSVAAEREGGNREIPARTQGIACVRARTAKGQARPGFIRSAASRVGRAMSCATSRESACISRA